MNDVKVTLNENEVKIVELIAKARYVTARQSGLYNDKKDDNQSNRSLDEEGFGAEMAFCKLCNIFPSFVTDGKDDMGVDCILNGRKTDVKQTKYQNGHLLVKGGKETDDTERFVLMTGQLPTFTYRGWLDAREVFQEKYKRHTPGKGISYWVPQSDMNWEIPEIINEKGLCS